MSQNNQDQEIDLSAIGNKISGYFDNFGQIIFNAIKFIKSKIIIIGCFFVGGAVIGHFVDQNNNAYVSDIIVAPNFGSTDNLYAKINLLESRLFQNDIVFLKQIGIVESDVIRGIEIDPVVDIYNFVNNNTAIAGNAQNTQNFELVKLLSEDSDIKKVIKEDLTSKHYSYHTIKISTDGKASSKKHIKPILDFLNKTPYYEQLRRTTIANAEKKIVENQRIIDQINVVLEQFENNLKNNQKSEKLIYNNENNQLNDLINNKSTLIAEIGNIKLQLVNIDKVVKPTSIVLNQKSIKGINGKMGKIMPILLLLLFFGFSILLHLYKKFNLKYA